VTAEFSTKCQDLALQLVSEAMRGAGQGARKVARQSGTGIAAANLPADLRAELLPALETLVARYPLEGLWLFGSWARGTASRRSDVDLLVMGLSDKRLLDAYDAVLEALQDCRLPVQPVVAGQALLKKHGDSPFWRSVKAEAVPLLEGCRFP
jgi:predicted nucleotidyltransferase